MMVAAGPRSCSSKRITVVHLYYAVPISAYPSPKQSAKIVGSLDADNAQIAHVHRLHTGQISMVNGHSNGRRRVVVTGMGTINPLGHTVDEFWSNALAGKSGVDWL